MLVPLQEARPLPAAPHGAERHVTVMAALGHCGAPCARRCSESFMCSALLFHSRDNSPRRPLALFPFDRGFHAQGDPVRKSWGWA